MSNFLHSNNVTGGMGVSSVRGLNFGGNMDWLQPSEYRVSRPRSRGEWNDGTYSDLLWPRCSLLGADITNIAPIWGTTQQWEWNTNRSGSRGPQVFSGTVRDSTGTAISGATVALYNTGSGVLVDTQTAGSGGQFNLSDPQYGDNFIVGYKTGSPDISGTTINKLGQSNFYELLTAASLTTGLQFCLDAGDAVSNPTGGTSWLDLSGNGQDFFNGIDATTTQDVTFFGYNGRRSAEDFFASMGPRSWFAYDTTTETWMNNIHKDNAKFSLAAWVHMAGTNAYLVGNNNNTTTNPGFCWRLIWDTSMVFSVTTGSGTALTATWTTTLPRVGQWLFVGLAVDEATATGLMYLNDNTNSFTSTYTTPSASASTQTFTLGHIGGNSAAGSTVGTRFAGFMGWDGQALTAANFQTIFNATRGRFGV